MVRSRVHETIRENKRQVCQQVSKQRDIFLLARAFSDASEIFASDGVAPENAATLNEGKNLNTSAKNSDYQSDEIDQDGEAHA